MKLTKYFRLGALILSNLMIVVFGFSTVLDRLSQEQAMVFDNIFGGPTSEMINISAEEEDTIYFKSWYQNVADLMDGNDAVSAAAMAEGSVLIHNQNNALPLAEGDKVSLFGVTAYDPIYTMNGGATKVTPNASRRQFFATEFAKAGLEVNEGLADWYNANSSTYFHTAVSGNGAYTTLRDAPWNAVLSSGRVPTSAGGTAIMIIGRAGNEAKDIPFVGDGYNSNENHLELTAVEKGVLGGLKAAKASGAFQKIVLIFNSTNVMQEHWRQVFAEYTVDASLWIGTPGTGGMPGVAALLVGKSNPSGRLADMWYSAIKNNPNTVNFISTSTSQHSHSTVVYQEGIYFGQRYAETRYEDYVMATPGAGTYDYDEMVSYPFGHGLSYSDFTYSNMTVARPSAEDGIYKVSVDIKNNSTTRAGKKAVQIYLQKPYTEYDKLHNIEKPSADFVAFGKTPRIQPGETHTITIDVDANRFFADYDAYGKRNYILQAGDYYLTIADNSHDATNNFLAAKGFSPANTDGRMDAAGDTSLVEKITLSTAIQQSYAYRTNTGNPVTQLFDHVDPNIIDPSAPPVTFMSRFNWEGTVFPSRTIVVGTDLRCADRAYERNGMVDPDPSVEYPTYGVIPETGVIPLIALRVDEHGNKRDFDDPLWQTFLDQLTWEETAYLLSHGWRTTVAIQSVSKPAISSPNGPLGFNWRYDYLAGEKYQLPGFAGRTNDPDKGMNCVGYPHHSIIASTFNIDLAYAIGQAYGEDALWAGFAGIFGLGLNMHRNPNGARNGEYYSDDAVLGGIIGGWMSKGIQDKGCSVYSKHFVLNDMDHNRPYYETWVPEQTLRQHYLRTFELAIGISNGLNVMTSFNRIGSRVSSGDTNLLTNYLRGEVGLMGLCITDGGSSPSYGMGMLQGTLSGNDLPDGSLNQASYNPDGTITIGEANEFYKTRPEAGGYGHVAQAMRLSAHRIMYATVHSNAMNYISTGTKIVVYPAAWTETLPVVFTSINVAFGISTTATLALLIWHYTEYFLKNKLLRFKK